jgi:hypothetical protein
MSVSRELSLAVQQRAEWRCQYCQMHQRLQGATFHIEHVIPLGQGGASDLENLVLACPGCNLHKADRTRAVDPMTGSRVQLFHPLRHIWSEHFQFQGYRIEGLTAAGRATVGALNFNHPRRLSIRAAEETFGLFPPAC